MFSAEQIRSARLPEAANMIRRNIEESDKWTVRGLLAIYHRQTLVEQEREQTTEDNGIGFNGADAPILTSFAKQIIDWGSEHAPKYSTPLSDKQIKLAKRKLYKYAGQLARIAATAAPKTEKYFSTVP